MAIKTLVISSNGPGKVQTDEYELTDVLGDSSKDIGVRIDEIVNSLSDTLRNSIATESELLIELSGGVELKAEGNAKWLFFNVGSSATTTGALKVSLKTTITPAVHAAGAP